MGLFTKALLVAVVVAVLTKGVECKSASRSGGSRSHSRSSGSSSSGGSTNRIIKSSDDGHGSASGGVGKPLNPLMSGPNLDKDSRQESVDHVRVQPHRSHVLPRRHRTETTEKPTSTTLSLSRLGAAGVGTGASKESQRTRR